MNCEYCGKITKSKYCRGHNPNSIKNGASTRFNKINASEFVKKSWENYSLEERIERGRNIGFGIINNMSPEVKKNKSEQHSKYLVEYFKTSKGKEHHEKCVEAAMLSLKKTKHYYSKKNDKTLFYHSTWELAAFEILEQLHVVKSYDRCRFSIPYELDGKSHKYFPDIIITYEDGIQEVIEIKPRSLLKYSKNITKIESLKKYCNERDLKFGIWTEDKIFARA